jgi:hypothetical protein
VLPGTPPDNAQPLSPGTRIVAHLDSVVRSGVTL